jgi:hypothetical protein
MGSTISRGRRARGVRATLGLLTVSLLSALSLVTTAAPAVADAEEGVGVNLDPGQAYDEGYLNWLGSYVVHGEQVFCVRYGFTAPGTNEEYKAGEELLDKWGQELEADVAANISYLLLQYGDTENPDEAAALAHLLHSWTAAPREGHDDLDESLSRQEIGYDVEGNFEQLPQSAKDAVERMRTEAEANRGPWTAKVSSPKDQLTIGETAEWTISVRNANDEGVPNRPVTVTMTGATAGKSGGDPGEGGETEVNAEVVALEDAADETTTEDSSTEDSSSDDTAAEDTTAEDGAETLTVTTGADGTATVRAVPTSTEATLTFDLVAPAERPYVRFPVEDGVQQVVSTGGEQQLQAEVTVNAKPAPPETTTETTTSTVVVPRTIPAGEQPVAVAQGDTHSGPGTGALAGLGALALIGAGLVGWLARRRLSQR